MVVWSRDCRPTVRAEICMYIIINEKEREEREREREKKGESWTREIADRIGKNQAEK